MRDAESVLRDWLRWASTVVSGALIGAGGGTLLGWLLARVSHDYVVEPSEYLVHGLKLGLFTGTGVAACQVFGKRHPVASIVIAARAMALAFAVTLLGVAVTVAVVYGAYLAGWLDTSSWRLPNPSRHALLMGVELALHPSALAGTVSAGVWVVLRRRLCALR